jgi:uncharacterized protein YkwD
MKHLRITHRTRLALPLLALFALAGMALFTACTPEANAELKTYSGINAIRAQHGLPPLQADAQLVNIARIRSRDMATTNYFSHFPPNGCNYVCLMDQNGVPHAYAGENIAWNTWPWAQTADEAVLMWKNSAPHLANILNCHYTRFGTGVVQAADGKIYYTMIFEGNAAC